MMSFKIATLNLFSDLPNTKEIVKQIKIEEKIDILCMQETNIDNGIDHELMSFPGSRYECETNNLKSRVGPYVKSSIDYVRRLDLEETRSRLIIHDVKCENNKHISLLQNTK